MILNKRKGIDDIVKIWLSKSKNPKKTYVVAVIHKKNKRLFQTVVELSNEIINISGTPYYAGNDAIFFKSEKIGKKKIDIPMVDVYEGVGLAVHPSKDLLKDLRFSKRVIDMISLYIEQGYLENKRKKKMDMRKIIMAVLIGLAAIFIIFKMF